MNNPENQLQELRSYLETLYGIELLEYHGMGHLAFDNKKRNQEKRAILERALVITGKSSQEYT